MYSEFDKARIANITRRLAEGTTPGLQQLSQCRACAHPRPVVLAAARAGNSFLRAIFHRAGEHVGRMVRTLAPYAPLRDDGTLEILGAGSVWKSVDLLAAGILQVASHYDVLRTVAI